MRCGKFLHLLLEIVRSAHGALARIDPGLRSCRVAALGVFRVGQALLHHVAERVEVVLGELLADLRQDLERPVRRVEPPAVVGALVKLRVRVDDGLVKDQREIEDDAGEIGDEQVGAPEHVEVIVVAVPLQILRVRVGGHELVDHVLFRLVRLGVRADDDMVAAGEQLVDDLAAVFAEDRARPPGRRDEHRRPVRRDGAGGVQPPLHLVHVGDADLHDLLGGQAAQRLERAQVADLIVAGDEDRVVIVDAEHPVAGDLVGRVQDVHIAVHARRALPLVDIQPRRGGQQHVRAQEVELGKGLVALAEKLRVHVRVGVLQRWIVGRRRQIRNVQPAPVQLAAHGLHHVPVALVVHEDGQRVLFLVDGGLFSAAQEKAQLDDPAPQRKVQCADDADQNGKEHAARARINVQFHVFRSPLPVASTARRARCRRHRTRTRAARRREGHRRGKVRRRD